MNITLTHGNNDSKFHQASYRIAALAAACTLGIAGAIGFTGISGTSSASAPVARSTTARAAVTQLRSHVVLVDSAEAKARMEAEMAMDSILVGTLDGRPDYIVVVKGTELEDSLTSASSPVQQLGTVQVTDTTLPAVPAQVAASEADISASVLSTELAAYGASVPQTQRVASEADIAASVLSTERATYIAPATSPQPLFAAPVDAEEAAKILR